jgi:hypothetical protein
MERDAVLQAAITQNLQVILELSCSIKAMEEMLSQRPELQAEYQKRRQGLKSGEYGRKLDQSVRELQQAFASIQRP